MSKGKSTSGIVSDGAERVVAANRAEVVRRVQAKYADELAGAGWLRRIVVRLMIRREVVRELRKLTPKGALYVSRPGSDPNTSSEGLSEDS